MGSFLPRPDLLISLDPAPLRLAEYRAQLFDSLITALAYDAVRAAACSVAIGEADEEDLTSLQNMLADFSAFNGVPESPELCEYALAILTEIRVAICQLPERTAYSMGMSSHPTLRFLINEIEAAEALLAQRIPERQLN